MRRDVDANPVFYWTLTIAVCRGINVIFDFYLVLAIALILISFYRFIEIDKVARLMRFMMNVDLLVQLKTVAIQDR